MPRGSRISRQALLQAAERLVLDKGAAALTIGALAAEAGVSKGGVQTMFGTKEALVQDLVQHWLDREQADFRLRLEAQAQPDKTLAHIDQTRGLDAESQGKIAALLALASHSPNQTRAAQDWYEERADGFAADTDEARRRRLAVFATEGVYFLRHLVGVQLSDAAWDEIFDDIRALVTAGE